MIPRTHLMEKASDLSRQGKWDEAIRAFERVIDRGGGSPSEIARARNAKAYALSQIGRDEEAVAEYDRLLASPTAGGSTNHEELARAMYNRGQALRRLDRNEEALDSFMQTRAYLESDELNARRLAADGLILAGATLLDLDLDEEAFSVFDELSDRFEQANEEELRERAVRARSFKAQALARTGRIVEAFETFADIENLTAESDNLLLRQHRAQAVYGAASALERLGQPEDATALYRRLLEIFDEHETPEVAEVMTYARARLGVSNGPA